MCAARRPALRVTLAPVDGVDVDALHTMGHEAVVRLDVPRDCTFEDLGHAFQQRLRGVDVTGLALYDAHGRLQRDPRASTVAVDDERATTVYYSVSAFRVAEEDAPPAKRACVFEERPPLYACAWIRYLAKKGIWQASTGINQPWHTYPEEEMAAHCAPVASRMESARASPGCHISIPRVGGFCKHTATQLKTTGFVRARSTDCETRACAAHAAFHIVRRLRPDLAGRTCSQARFEALLPGTALTKDDKTVDDVARAVKDFGVRVDHVRMVSPRILVSFREGVYLLELGLTYEDGAYDRHFTVYDAPTGVILDSLTPETFAVDDRDRQAKSKKRANRNAMRAFQAVFAAATKITFEQVYRCSRND